MSDFNNRTLNPHVSGYGEVSNSNAALTLVPASVIGGSSKTKIHPTNIIVSVITAAVGGGGILQLRNTNGTVFMAVDVNSVGVKPSITLGREGIDVGEGVGIDAVVSGAVTTQATVWIAMSGYAYHVSN
jgi:hypothetical protein